MSLISTATAVRAALTGGLGARTWQSTRDGCTAFTAFALANYVVADQAPVQSLRPLAELLDTALPLHDVEPLLRVQLFGGFVLNSLGSGASVAVLSFLIRTGIALWRNLRAEASNG